MLADTLQSSTAGTPPQFNDGNGTQVGTLCRAWVNFDGTASGTITPRASFNVGSVTKNGTGDYTINFSTAMPDANYGFTCGAGTNASAVAYNVTSAPAAGSLRIGSATPSTATNLAYLCVAVFR